MDPTLIIKRYYAPDSQAYTALMAHSEYVVEKALKAACHVKHLKPDTRFIEEAGMLHDIGIVQTHAPKMGCFGEHPYICHGYLGREMVEKAGFPKHALVCERHVGVGLSVNDIHKQKLPLPVRDMRPVTLEEQIISYADKYYSKSKGKFGKQKSLKKIRRQLKKIKKDYVVQFDQWLELFE
ncbi:HDIG domain-containing protein [Desulfococcaceae bacterium HSG7]|nr:HDIG domain-containing protein [Desulfococcaceae bacterium HSG7]